MPVIYVTPVDTPSIKRAWTNALQSQPKRMRILWGSICIAFILSLMPLFFKSIQKRQGIILHDGVLASLPSHDVSVPIFLIIWGMGLLILVRALYKPEIYINYVWTLVFVSLARMLAITCVALEPPVGLVNLVDPLTGVFYGNASVTRDLFFSGHTATLVLVFLCLEKRNDKIIAFVAIIAVAILLMIQHIHYTIDILAAPLVVYIVFLLTRYFLKLDKLDKLSDNQS
ncbi:hypothetical protein FPZ43_10870 [Mucilaginibacter pallidiroseus]|uniref:Sphingomyelin synthase-like domain-containing protein n=1 Tax=Mucilaginibacter pallidiroseus TaxID=2599295 RepID=A0A563UDN7_9SPHI|nr:phosphatase PAP2-related protein [Mucilaginibacter pallidiroseus]TWR29444.1 hypothetical protein FPZ43_10870 [Mucilaginibacter pallidiroseus]